MCTILLAYQVDKKWPVILGNNRDEFYHRLAVPPRVFTTNNRRRWLAPIDLVSGGSWWACNNDGLLICLTNRWVGLANEAGKVSRGQLVYELVQCREPAAVRKKLDTIDISAYGPFNLLVVSAVEGFLFTNYPEADEVPLISGFYFIGNGTLLNDRSLKEKMAKRVFTELKNKLADAREITTLFYRLLRLPLPQEFLPPQGFNVLLDDYGTTSSTLLTISAQPTVTLGLSFAAGNPLRAPLVDYSGLSRFLF